MADFTVSIPDEQSAVIAAAFQDAYGTDGSSAGVIAYLGDYIAETVAGYLRRQATATATAAVGEQISAAQSAIVAAFAPPAPVAVPPVSDAPVTP